MDWAGCETDNSVVTMRNGTCHVATVLGRQEGVVGTVANQRAPALQKGAAPAVVARQKGGPRGARSSDL